MNYVMLVKVVSLYRLFAHPDLAEAGTLSTITSAVEGAEGGEGEEGLAIMHFRLVDVTSLPLR